MRIRSTAIGALFLTAGCATSASTEPASRPRERRAAPAAAVTHQARSEQPSQPVGITKPGPPPTPLVEAPPTPEAEPVEPSAVLAAPAPVRPSRADPFGDVGFKEVNEKDWLAAIRTKIAQQEKVEPTVLRLSPGLLRAVFVKSSPVAAPAKAARTDKRRIPPRRHEIVVVDNQGKRVASFRPIAARGSDEPPGDVRFLSEERLVYEVISPEPAAAASPPARRAALGKPKDRPAPGARATPKPGARPGTRPAARPGARPVHPAPVAVPSPPPRLFIIQPLASGARPIRCQGLHFTFAPTRDRLAFVAGQAGTAFVAVDGKQVYPRRGRTIVASAPLWSKDGLSLAFLEQPAAHPARLVLVAALDNPAGDMVWELPADAKIDGASVFWAGAGKLAVRKTAAARPIFSTSFATER